MNKTTERIPSMSANTSLDYAKKYDIFISYRRDGGESMAILLHDRLTQKGYRVFLDIDIIYTGFITKHGPSPPLEHDVEFIIKGVEYSTSLTELYLSGMGLEDDDIVPLQYMTYLRF
jgi:hypothetical protein